MPHVAFVPLTGLRVRAEEMLELGMTLPGLRQRADALAELPALGLLTLAGMTPSHWSCSWHAAAQAMSDPSTIEGFVDSVCADRPSLVALSALTASVEDAYRLSRQFRARGVPVVIGGLHVTAMPDEAAQHCDAVVIGDGEPVWQQVLTDVESRRLQPKYRATQPFDLSQSPVPRYELLGEAAPPRSTLQTERGCPFACDFCGASRLLGPFREKPLDRVRAELAAIGRRSERPWLELADDNTFAGARDPLPLLEALGESGARYFTEVDWRIGERPDLLQALAASGCVQVLIGIESLSFRYPGMGSKQADISRMMDAIRAIQGSGVVANGCFIVGAEGETPASLDRLTEFVLASPLAEVQITLQTPFPGTALFQRLNREGRLLEDRGWSHYTLFDVTYRPSAMSVAELEAGFRSVLSNVFATPAAQRRAQLRKQIWRNNPRF